MFTANTVYPLEDRMGFWIIQLYSIWSIIVWKKTSYIACNGVACIHHRTRGRDSAINLALSPVSAPDYCLPFHHIQRSGEGETMRLSICMFHTGWWAFSWQYYWFSPLSWVLDPSMQKEEESGQTHIWKFTITCWHGTFSVTMGT